MPSSLPCDALPCLAVPIERLRLIVESYRRLTGKELIDEHLLLPPCRGKGGMGVDVQEDRQASTPTLTLPDGTTNGHGKYAVPDDETCHARFPHLNPLPQAGEEANESLREFLVNQSTKPASGQVAGYLQGGELARGQDEESSLSIRLALWNAPRAIVAHGTEDDPVFFYGNRLALELFEMDFATFAKLPSRYSAEPLERDSRARLLERVSRQGYVDDYAGVRIAASGKRFMIEAATVWNLIDEAGNHRGQAATFTDWRML